MRILRRKGKARQGKAREGNARRITTMVIIIKGTKMGTQNAQPQVYIV